MIERYLSGFFLLLSGLYFYFANDISFGELAKPKAGFLPNIIGFLAFVLSGINFFITMRKKIDSGNEGTIDAFAAKNIALVCVGTIAYIVLLSFSGYLIATALYLFYLIKVTRTKGIIKPALLSIGVVFAFYFCFVILLDVALP
jgi:putative tricarboxylic transport membrane protein